jgi:cell wall-associated NlpC family hydrolase
VIRAVAGVTAAVAALGVVALTAIAGAGTAAGEGIAGLSGLKPGAVPAQYAPWVLRAGQECPQFPPAVIAAQIQAESGWNPAATSPAGAQGLSQFMQGTWATWGRDDDGNGTASPFDPGDAIMAQARFDCALADQLRGRVSGDLTSLALAAYNAGPGAVLAAGGIPPYPQTQAYVPRILALAGSYAATTVPASVQVAAVLRVAQAHLGTPYAYGGGGQAGPGPGLYGGTVGWDCSSYMQFVFFQGAHVDLPRTSQQQRTVGRAVSRDQLAPGDLIVFSHNGWGHVGVYIGNGRMIHEPKTGDVAKVATIVGNAYWEGQQWDIRRVL